MKVYDCFPFWREFIALEIRLEELYEIVDFFVVIESAYTHTGEPKEFHLKNNLHRFSKYSDKIILVSDSEFKRKHNPIQRGNFQRGLIDKYLKRLNLEPSDIVIISDSDEIPKREVIQSIKNSPSNSIIEVSTYSSFLNLYFHEWPRVRILQFRDYRGAQKEFRETFINYAIDQRRFKWYPFLRINQWFSASRLDRVLGVWVGFKPKKLQVIKNGGWHFTKIYDVKTLMEKIRYSGHTEFNTPDLTLSTVKKDLKNLLVPYGRKLKGEVRLIDESFPHSIKNNQKKYSKYLLKPTKNGKL